MLRKIIGRSGWMLVNPWPIQNYCGFSSKSKWQDIRTQLIDEHHKLRPDAIIKIAHTLHTREQSQNVLTPQQTKHIFDKLISQISKLRHQDLTLLLEVVSKTYTKYYNGNTPILRQIGKRIFSIHALQLSPDSVYPMLHILISMRFPPSLVSKYVQAITNNHQQLASDKSKPGMKNVDILRTCITLMELKYVPMLMVEKFYDNVMEKSVFREPIELCYLYYFLKYCRVSLKEKIGYFEEKGKVHDLLFNPYSSLVEQQQGEDGEGDQEGDKDQNMKKNVDFRTQRLEEIDLFMTKVQKKNDLKKLQQEIFKIYAYESFPITPISAVFLTQIKSLQQTLTSYLQSNHNKLTPNQFIIICKAIPQPMRQASFKAYIQEMSDYFSLHNKLSMMRFGHRYCGEFINKEKVIEAIRGEELGSGEFKEVCEILSLMGERERAEVVEMLKQIVG